MPKIGHQVRVRIRREAFALDFLAEIIQLIFAQAAFHESAGINAGRGVALDKHQIALGIIVFGVPEMVEAHVIQGGGRLERSDVAAQLQIFFAGAQHHGGGIPADNGADAVFQFLIARRFLLFAHRNGVQISGGGIKRQMHTAAAGVFHQVFQQEMRALGAFAFQHRAQCIQPLLGFNRINVVNIVGLGGHSHPSYKD